MSQSAVDLARLNAAAAAVDGVDQLGEDAMLRVRAEDPGVSVYIKSVDGELVAAALRNGQAGSVELVVHPRHRRRGYGQQLLQEAFAVDRATGVWAHGALPQAAQLAAKLNLVPVRELVKMARDVDGAPLIQQPTMPTGFSVHTLRDDADSAAWLELNTRAFVGHPEQGAMTSHDLAQRMDEPWFDPAGMFFIRHDASGVVAATHWTKVADPSSGIGEVYAVAVDPAYQGHGLGKSVTALGLDYLRRRGLQRIELYTEGDNTAALATYRGLGFEIEQTHLMYAHPNG